MKKVLWGFSSLTIYLINNYFLSNSNFGNFFIFLFFWENEKGMNGRCNFGNFVFLGRRGQVGK